MTSDETRSVVERMFLALGKGDRETLLDVFAEDAVWQLPDSVPNNRIEGGMNIVDELGRNVITRLFKPKTFKLTIRKMIVAGDTAAVQQASQATTHEGKEYRMEYCWVYTCENGRVKHIREYLDTYIASKVFEWEKTP